jgi:hypothetical protein
MAANALAMEAARAQKVIGLGTWKEKIPALWICQSSCYEDFYFSMESWPVVSEQFCWSLWCASPLEQKLKVSY